MCPQVNPPTPYFDHQSLPEEYLSDSFPTSEKAVDAVKCMLATELASEPSIRHALREKFISTASISTKPTELGIENINPFSELFGVHFLKQKPLKDFLTGTTSDRYLYARLARAKSEGLLEIQINYPTIETPFGLRPDLDTYLNSTGSLSHSNFSFSHACVG
jgi:transcriptional accessory protein Tex/SPT6